MKKSLAVMLALIMVLCMIPTTAFAASNSTVVLHPSVNHTVTGVKVKVGDKIDGHPITKISGYDITVDLGKYNVNNDTFRLPYAKDIWEGVDNNKVDYISWAGSGSNKRSEGASALLANGKNTAYYYFNGAPTYKTFTLKYNANGGTGAPATQTYTATSQYENSHTFTISNDKPTRQDYEFKGWAETPNATTATRQPGGKIVVTGTTTLYAVWEENYTPNPSAPPSVPGPDTLKKLLDKIKVTCVTSVTAHGTKGFDLIDGSYTVGDVEGDATSGYTCEVSISPDKYVDEYNKLIKGHTVTEATAKIVTLKSNNDSAWVVDRGTPVEFNVKCETSEPTPPSDTPSKPDANTLKKLLDKIKVTCVTSVTAHGTKGFDLIDGSYTVGDVEGDATSGYTCEVSISPDKYVDEYNKLIKGHTVTEATAKIVTLKSNNDSAWVVDRGTPVEFNVKCETSESTPPAKPTDNDVPDIIGRGAVKVHCINDYDGYDDQSYGIFNGSFSIGDVILKGDDYTCDITVYPELYVAEYVKDFGKPHTLSPAGQTGTITLIYDAEEQAWKPMPNYDPPIVFNVTCSDEDETFTVTYLDGFSGTYATYTNLKYGDATPVPANPYRSGYIFLGWQPSVAPTVTGDARYVAQWGYIGPQYPNPTPVQPIQPGILPPQTGDMPLWYAIARFLGLVK